MEKYFPETLMIVGVHIQNVVLFACCAWLCQRLFEMSGSWWSLLGLLMLAMTSTANFKRD